MTIGPAMPAPLKAWPETGGAPPARADFDAITGSEGTAHRRGGRSAEKIARTVHRVESAYHVSDECGLVAPCEDDACDRDHRHASPGRARRQVAPRMSR
jgi:hypothetical protein